MAAVLTLIPHGTWDTHLTSLGPIPPCLPLGVREDFQEACCRESPGTSRLRTKYFTPFSSMLTSKGVSAVIPNLQMRELRGCLKGHVCPRSPKVILNGAVPSATGWYNRVSSPQSETKPL